MKSVALYSPYIPKHSGGGEKYLLSIAEVASKTAHTTLLVPLDQVEKTRESLARYSATFGLDLSRVGVKPTMIGQTRSPIKTMSETAKYDVLFAMTDGSIFPTLAKRSYLIMQVPWTRALSTSERLKLRTWKKVLVYSDFVHDVLAKHWKIKNLEVLPPYVDTTQFVAPKPSVKEPLIMNVGRFFAHDTSNSKRQDVVIDVFKTLYESGVLKGYSLVLMGNVDPNPDSYHAVEELKAKAKGFPIDIMVDAPFETMKALYQHSRFYWHAAGYGVDQEHHPEQTEHFGITTLEAMSSGCIPLVVPNGGQREVVGDAGFFWETKEELMGVMKQVVKEPKAEISAQSERAIKRAAVYGKQMFIRSVEELL